MSAPHAEPVQESAAVIAGRSQAEAADPRLSVWVRANAGSGKTTVLINRAARLLLAGAAPDSILCVTYTKAAAAEMQARLFERLGAWSTAEDAALAAELARLEPSPAEPLSAEAEVARLRRARTLFARALETPGGLRIETIHAFCDRVLKRFPLEAGIVPGHRILEDTESARLWREALLATVAAADSGHADPTLGEAFARLSRDAGGRGPEEVLSQLLGRRVELEAQIEASQGVEGVVRRIGERVGAPTSPPEELVRDVLSALPREPIARALGALASKTAEKTRPALEALLAALSDPAPDPAEVREIARPFLLTASNTPLKQAFFSAEDLKRWSDFAAWFAPPAHKSLPMGTLTEALLRLLTQLDAAELAARSAAAFRVFAHASADDRRRRERVGGLGFDDLIHRVSKLLSSPGVAEWVLYKLDGGLNHILVDEAQDTSPGQWPIFNSLVAEFFAGAGRVPRKGADPRTLFVVGDEKQSIYRFQGADPEGFIAQRQAFARPDAPDRVLPDLAVSFRTVPEILAVVDKVSELNPLTVAATDPGASVADIVHHIPARVGHQGRVEVWSLPQAPDASPEASLADPVDAPRRQEPARVLAAEIAGRIRQMLDDGCRVHVRCAPGEETEGPVRGWRTRPLEPRDILILVRRRGRLYSLLPAELQRLRVPIAGQDRLSLTTNLAVRDCLNLMRFALAPEDDLTLAEVLKSPFCGWTDAALEGLAWPAGADRAQAGWWARLSAQEPPPILSRALSDATLSPAAFLSRVLQVPATEGDRTGAALLQARFGDGVWLALDALNAAAREAESQGVCELQAFLHRFATEAGEVKRDATKAQNAVAVMTVHGAKGLEAPVVFLPDTTQGVHGPGQMLFTPDGLPLWHRKAEIAPPAVEELRTAEATANAAENDRLLYVAMTRAQDLLVVCGHPIKNGEAENCWRARVEAAVRSMPESSTFTLPDGREAVAYGPDLPRSAALAATAGGASPGSGVRLTPLPAALARRVPVEASGPGFVSPSTLATPAEAEITSPVLAPLQPDRGLRLRRGRLIHRLVERLPALAPAARRAAAERLLATETDLSDRARAEILNAAFGVLDHPDFAALFGPGSRAEVAVVGRLPALKGAIINGRVDRLVVTDSEVIIADLKTDRPAPVRVEDVGEAYLVQMAAYALLLADTFPGRTVRAGLLWTDGPAWMELPHAVLMAAFRRAI